MLHVVRVQYWSLATSQFTACFQCPRCFVLPGLVLNGHRLLEMVARQDSQVELHGHIQLDSVPLRHMQT